MVRDAEPMNNINTRNARNYMRALRALSRGRVQRT
jgi:hypothetical protein